MNAVQHDFDVRSLGLLELGRALRRDGYAFITVTPETHRRVNERAEQAGQGQARTLRDVFGWNRPFQRGLLPRRMLELLAAADQLESVGEDLLRSKVRFSTAENHLFVHSAYPTVQHDAVFFGPDTYRFCSLVQRWAPQNVSYAVDVCGGSGAGGLVLGGRAKRIAIADINRKALSFAAINAALAGIPLETVESDVLAGIVEQPDLIIANPPYMRDAPGRAYRDGGGQHGEGLSVRIVREALDKLAPGGELILYTGTAIVNGQDSLREQVAPILQRRAAHAVHDFLYEELDPDVFGEELSSPVYGDVERIAVVGLHVRMS
jgi:methylase of polypeptide subunit release factors